MHNVTLFSEERSGLRKMLAQNHQVLGVNKAIPALLEARAAGHGRGGVFWHTQGAGKSLSMVFFAQKILRHIEGNWTFVVLTDRVELDHQIAKTFKATGAVRRARRAGSAYAGSGADLRGRRGRAITGTPSRRSNKFQTPDMLCATAPTSSSSPMRPTVCQYDMLGVPMRAALTKAWFHAFTGTHR